MNNTLKPKEKDEAMTKKTSSQFYDLNKLKKDAEELRDSSNAEAELKKNLMFEEKNISLFHIYKHLSEPIDFLFMILATIGSLGSGISMPIMSYITTDVYADIGVTSEVTSDRDSLMATVKDVFTTQEKRYLILGIIAFVCNFLSICFWSLMGSRMCHKLKRLYFKVILSQEQGWFDENNPFEFATKVQAQLEQVEMGIGEKFGQVLQMSSQCILAFILAFILSWQVTLVMLCISPLIIVDILLM